MNLHMILNFEYVIRFNLHLVNNAFPPNPSVHVSIYDLVFSIEFTSILI